MTHDYIIPNFSVLEFVEKLKELGGVFDSILIVKLV